MKLLHAILFFSLIISCLSSSAQDRKQLDSDPLTTTIAQLSDTVSGTSSLFFWDGCLWTLNDHGNLYLYAIDTSTGAITQTIALPFVIDDMEEVAQDSAYLYFGDFGNVHIQLRDDLRILRISKADIAMGNCQIDTIAFTYSGYDPMADNDYDYFPITNFDCEAMVASGDSLYLFTKEWTSMQTTCYSVPKTPGRYVAQPIARLNVHGLITGSAYLEHERILALCGYNAMLMPFVYIFYDFNDNQFFEGRSERLGLNDPLGTQVEGIATLDGMRYFLTSEYFSGLGVERQPLLLGLDLSAYLYDYLHPDTSQTDTTAVDTLETDMVLGISNFESQNVVMFPNPASSSVNYFISGDMLALDAALVIVDVRGHVVMRQPIRSANGNVDISSLPQGVYLACFVCSKGKVVKRLVVE